MKNIAAFFDIDGTLFRNSLMIEHFKKMIRYEVIDPTLWYGRLKDSYSEWEKRYGDFEDYMDELVAIYVKELKGINKSYIEFIASQVINMNWDKVYRYTRARIKWHKEQGHMIFFISGAPDFLVEKMAEKYQVTAFKATRYIVDENNNFTGEVVSMWDSENKQKAVEQLVNQYKVDLKASFSYGDTTGDLSMLKKVGNPVAVNPIRKLLMAIKQDKELYEKTTIIVERKDLIYELSPAVNLIQLE
ncbi:HAD-IB family hydrolase [Tepidanaerobacter sp. GT38]|uniref:HAD family hydrolase n=1 Tax=Tepidanaerobacter sp. GT38 TaxID=2722793 RepID=UPI001F0171F1|nr:HAD-IB family hydrolase [Tepidanaerobacter sp. GT38]